MGLPIEVILFDVGGVLVEVRGAAMLRSWMGRLHTAEEVWRIWLRSPAVRAFEAGRTTDPTVFAAELVTELALPVTPEEFLTDFKSWTPRPFPGAIELLGDVASHLRRSSLWNSNSVHWPGIMEGMRLAEWFDRDFASHLTGRLKPDPEAFEHAVVELGYSPEAMLFLDDNQINVAAAGALGLRAHQTRGPREARAVLQEYGLLKTTGPV